MSTEFYLADGRRFAHRHWCGEENGPRLTMEITRQEFRQLRETDRVFYYETSSGADMGTFVTDFMSEMLEYGCEILWETPWHAEQEND